MKNHLNTGGVSGVYATTQPRRGRPSRSLVWYKASGRKNGKLRRFA